MSDIRTLNKKTKSTLKARKGISPVIATVILVAVAVVIAAALAGFSSSLFGSYAQNSQISVTKVTLTTAGTGTLTIVNKGSAQDTVTNVSLAGNNAVTLTTSNTVPANSAGTVISYDLGSPSPALVKGQQVSITVTMGSGSTMTLSAIVS